MSRYYIRDASTGDLIVLTMSPQRIRVFEHGEETLGEATEYLSYGEAQCEALSLRRHGIEAHVVNESDAKLSLARLREAV